MRGNSTVKLSKDELVSSKKIGKLLKEGDSKSPKGKSSGKVVPYSKSKNASASKLEELVEPKSKFKNGGKSILSSKKPNSNNIKLNDYPNDADSMLNSAKDLMDLSQDLNPAKADLDYASKSIFYGYEEEEAFNPYSELRGFGKGAKNGAALGSKKGFKYSTTKNGEIALDLKSTKDIDELDEEVLDLKVTNTNRMNLKDGLEDDDVEKTLDLKKHGVKKTNLKDLEKDLKGKYRMDSRGALKGGQLEDKMMNQAITKGLGVGKFLIPGAGAITAVSSPLSKSVGKSTYVNPKDMLSEDEYDDIMRQEVSDAMQSGKLNLNNITDTPFTKKEDALKPQDYLKMFTTGAKNTLMAADEKIRSAAQGLISVASLKLATMIVPFTCLTLILAIAFFQFHGITTGILSGYVGALDDEVSPFMHFDSDTIEEKILARGYEEINGVKVSTLSEEEQALLRYAFTKVGCFYAPAKLVELGLISRTGENSYDCSGLAYMAELQAGKDIGSGCAAQQAYDLYKAGKALASVHDTMEIGDLVFFGGTDDELDNPNGRYLNIYHVAIFVGNGYFIEAAGSSSGVVYRPVHLKNAVMICRP